MKSQLFLLVFLNFFYSCSASPSDGGENSGGTPLPTTPTPPVTVLTDEQAMKKKKKDAIKYFWDYAEPNSKLGRERYLVDNPAFEANKVTTGGSGFGLMSLIVGVERGFIPRKEAVARMTTAMDFLEKADRFHGAWAHWMDGKTGHAISFGKKDDGGDIVETAFLCQGLIAVREKTLSAMEGITIASLAKK